MSRWYDAHLQGIKDGYKAVLGVEYGAKQAYEMRKAFVEDYIEWTLYRRGMLHMRMSS